MGGQIGRTIGSVKEAAFFMKMFVSALRHKYCIHAYSRSEAEPLRQRRNEDG